MRAISFTGSVPVGRSVREEATARNCRVQLELGGQNPLVVMADAELDRAVEAAYAGAFWSAGQKCTATRRILVQDAVYDDFRERHARAHRRRQGRRPADPDVEVGPVVNEGAMEEVLAAIARASSDGTVLAGGERADDDGYLIAPTLVEGLADDAELACEEVFGPVASLYRFATFDEAIARANAVRFGLSAAIFTRDLHAVQRFSEEIGAGIIHVNSQTAGADVHVPFGGVKESGWGPHEQGRAAIEFYTETVTVYQDAPLDLADGSRPRGGSDSLPYDPLGPPDVLARLRTGAPGIAGPDRLDDRDVELGELGLVPEGLVRRERGRDLDAEHEPGLQQRLVAGQLDHRSVEGDVVGDLRAPVGCSSSLPHPLELAVECGHIAIGVSGSLACGELLENRPDRKHGQQLRVVHGAHASSRETAPTRRGAGARDRAAPRARAPGSCPARAPAASRRGALPARALHAGSVRGERP